MTVSVVILRFYQTYAVGVDLYRSLALSQFLSPPLSTETLVFIVERVY